jgi:acyl-coenzyme A synthetase/AMP-(fatty) acid ligase
MPNRAALVIHYLACMRSGLVAVPLNYRYVPPQIEHTLERAGVSLIFNHVERSGDLDAVGTAADVPFGRITYEAARDNWPHFERLILSPAAGAKLPAFDPEAPAFIFFTSGSTGTPKGVTHTYESLRWMFGIAARAFEMTGDDVVLPGSSISHLGGFMFSFAALSSGARAVVAHTFDSGEILPLLRDDRPTVLCMLPTALLKMLRDEGARPEDFASLRLCRCGADKVPAELARQFTAITGLNIDEGYGMTEVGLASLNPPSGLIKLGSVGPACPGVTFSIRGENGEEVAHGEEGRLFTKTPALTAGYWGEPELTRETIADGWIDSGDLMRADEDSYLWFRGRKKQIIVHDGSNIAPQEVEEALLDHQAIESAGAVGVDDFVHGENVMAFVTLKEGATRPSAQSLIRFARARIGYRAPEEIEFLDEMPMNATGKVDRVTLKKLAAERHAHDAPS